MKPETRIALGLVSVTLLLFVLGSVVPTSHEPSFFSRLAARLPDRSRFEGRSFFRGPARLPVPERYVEATRAEVARRMAEPDWNALTQDEKRGQILEILVLSGADLEYWSMSEARQRRVAEAYVRAFLDPSGRH